MRLSTLQRDRPSQVRSGFRGLQVTKTSVSLNLGEPPKAGNRAGKSLSFALWMDYGPEMCLQLSHVVLTRASPFLNPVLWLSKSWNVSRVSVVIFGLFSVFLVFSPFLVEMRVGRGSWGLWVGM